MEQGNRCLVTDAYETGNIGILKDLYELVIVITEVMHELYRMHLYRR